MSNNCINQNLWPFSLCFSQFFCVEKTDNFCYYFSCEFYVFFTQVLQFMVEQKLPKEMAAKQTELRIYEDVIAERNINTDYLNRIQHQVSFREILIGCR